MFTVMVVGLGLVIFGALVLLKFPNRPGGKIGWNGVEISSVGAGLPLIFLGVVCIVISNTSIPAEFDIWNREPESNGQTSSGSDDCFEYFQGMPKDRVKTLEEGAQDVQLIGPHQSKDEAIAIKFTENNQPIGAIKFYFYSNNNMFKVETVVDSNCQPIEEYSNIDRGGDKHVLQNWDTLQIRFEDSTYELCLGYDAGMIDTNFRRVSPPPYKPTVPINISEQEMPILEEYPHYPTRR